jgi:hypothetical protein
MVGSAVMLSYSKNWEYEHIDDGKQHPDVSRQGQSSPLAAAHAAGWIDVYPYLTDAALSPNEAGMKCR